MNRFAVGVASVGAGYTTFLCSDAGAALIDFGAPRGSQAVEALDRFVNPCPSRHWWPWWRHHWGPGFSELVISHPHADHYSGLLHLASSPLWRQRYPSLLAPEATFYYPMVPREPVARRLVAYLDSLNQIISRLPENVLGRAVAATSSGPVRGIPLSRGDQIELAGVPVDVLWPPPTLDAQSTARLLTLVREYEQVAREAAERGDDRLIRVVAAVRDKVDDMHEQDFLHEVPEGREQAALYEIGDDFSDEGTIEQESAADDPSFKARLKMLRSALSKGANLISLVLATRPQRYVFLGDLDMSLHAAIVPALEDEEHELILSAHHGTHFGSRDLLRLESRFVVSSVGPPRLHTMVRPEWTMLGTHVRTDTAGDVMVDIHDGATHLSTCGCYGS